ncbi:MAG: methyltransferase domain-containing protein [Candidatus Aenigmarchaeota archaeon]|nr:methyltransferase domain-containing protein [Candidatus Aenigmarchaeota archaeon]
MKCWFTLNELKKRKAYEAFLHLYRYKYAAKNLRGKVLDIGCGAGFNLKNKNWYGIDMDKEAIKMSKKKGIVKLGSISKIPFKNNTFEGVCCLEVIEHVPGKKSPVKEITRVLRTGGRVVISTPNPRLINFAKRLGWSDDVHDSKDYFIEEKELINIFKKNGFKLKEARHFFWIPSSLRFLFPLSRALGELFRPICYNYMLLLEKQA